MLEMLQYTHAFYLGCSSVNVQFPKFPRIMLQESVKHFKATKYESHFKCEDIIGEYDDFITSVFMILDQKLASLYLFRVHAV